MLTPAHWAAVQAAFAAVSRLPRRTDADRYGVPELWRAADALGGDCEDLALAALAHMRAAGVPPEALMLTACWTPAGAYHAVAMVTGEWEGRPGTWVLDNLQARVRSQDELVAQGYRWDRGIRADGAVVYLA